ncbi:sensor histidine kinase [Paractinoplanes rishiriensis]|nr:ATP-binding protein [Actinoplanes rishiriensis]
MADEMATDESFLHAILDNVDTGVAACDSYGRMIFVNPALRVALALSGTGPFDVEEWQSALFRTDGTRLPADEIPLRHALAGRPVRDAEIVIRPLGESARSFLANAAPIRETDGRLAGAVMALHDVTRQRRTERFRGCELEVAAALVAATTVTEAGPRIAEAVARTLGWPLAELWLLDEVTGQPRAAGRWAAPDCPAVDPGIGLVDDVWETGEPRWVPDPAGRAAVAVPIREDSTIGVLACYAGTVEDDEKSIVGALRSVADHIGQWLSRRRSAGLSAQLDRIRDDFVALVGHEMRTPLTSIAANIEMLSEDDSGDPETREMLAAVQRNTAQLTMIVDDLLDLAGLRSGHVTVHPRPTDLAGAARDCLAAVGPAAEAGGLELKVDAPDHLVGEADPQRLRQVIDSLLSNAVKYSRPGGHILLRLSTDQEVAELSVTDTGIGVPEEDRTRLFRQIFRATNARHTATPGAGLGLAVTCAIVEAHHGTVSAAHHDPGTTVTVRLPLRQPA